jgi:hypothetical protein
VVRCFELSSYQLLLLQSSVRISSPQRRAHRVCLSVSFLVPLLHGRSVLASAWYRATPPTLSCLETQHNLHWGDQPWPLNTVLGQE